MKNADPLKQTPSNVRKPGIGWRLSFMQWATLPAFLLLLGLLGFSACRFDVAGPKKAQSQPDVPVHTNGGQTGTGHQDHQQANVPAYAQEVLTYVRAHNRAPEGYVGGRTFENREQNLPQKDKSNQKIKYREWDVHPKVSGQNRGAERLITGSDDSAWYTENHYRSFIKIE
jgi:ribonuclease T1